MVSRSIALVLKEQIGSNFRVILWWGVFYYLRHLVSLIRCVMRILYSVPHVKKD